MQENETDHVSDLARVVADDMVKNEGADNVKAFDPMTIMVIIQIISFIINLFKKKTNTPEGIKSLAGRANLIQRAFIKNRLKRYMRENSDHYDTYVEHKDTALKSVLRKISATEDGKLQAVMSATPGISAEYLN